MPAGNPYRSVFCMPGTFPENGGDGGDDGNKDPSKPSNDDSKTDGGSTTDGGNSNEKNNGNNMGTKPSFIQPSGTSAISASVLALTAFAASQF